MNGPTQLFIGGKYKDARSGKTFPSINPATEEVIAQVAEADAPDIDDAVKAARSAFNNSAWRDMGARERSKLLWKLGDLITSNAEELAMLESIDNGKPIFESRHVDIPSSAETFYYYAGGPPKSRERPSRCRATFQLHGARALRRLRDHHPVEFPSPDGRVEIGPGTRLRKYRGAQNCGGTPLTGLRLGQLCQEAGIPDGVVNVVPGYGETAGRALVAHPDVNKISFTGSTAVGKEIVRTSADSLKKVSLELGGKSPNIIFADCDLDAAARAHLTGFFMGKAKSATAGSRLFVEKSIHDKLMGRLLDRAARLEPGDPQNPKTRLGALVSKTQMDRVLSYVEIDGPRVQSQCCRADEPAPAAISSSRPFLIPRTPTCGSRRKRSSARSSPCSRSRAWMNSWLKRIQRYTGWQRQSGRGTSQRRTTSPGEFTPARCGSMPTTCSRPNPPLEATNSPASDGN